MVIVLKTLSILFKGNLNFLFFSHMQEDVIWRQLHHSFCQPLTTPPYNYINLFPGPTQCQCRAWLTQPYSLLKPFPPRSPLFTNCKPTQDADHWPMTQSPIHAGCFQSGDVSPGVLRLIRMSYCLGVASRSRQRVSKVMDIIPMLWEAFVSQCSRKSDTKNKSQVW